ncbi:MAG: autotransporter domain-containing protein, partial [Proteobacteria bacterium]|nr:autotransporter domain-containing protein [Pseudomonadota bacterium]
MKVKILNFLVPGLLLSTQIYAAQPTGIIQTISGTHNQTWKSSDAPNAPLYTSPFGIAPYNKGLVITDGNTVRLRLVGYKDEVKTIAGSQEHPGNLDGCGRIAPRCIVDEIMNLSKHSSTESGSDSDSDSELDGLAKFGKLAGVATIGKDKDIFVADTDNNSVRVLQCRMDRDFRVPEINYLTKSIKVPNGPTGMASDGDRFVYTTTSGGIYEIDASRKKPKARLIAGRVLKDGSDSDSGSGYDSDSDSERKPRGKLKGLFGIAHTEVDVVSGKPTLYFIAENKIKKLTSDGCRWGKPVDVVTDGLNNPRGIAIKDGKLYVTEQENTDIKLIDLTSREVTVTTIKPKEAQEADKYEGYEGVVVDTDGKIYLTATDDVVVRELSLLVKSPPPPPVSDEPPSGGGGGGAGDVTVTAVGNILDKATKPAGNNSDDAGEQEFRFGLSSEQIMLTMRQRGVNFAENSSNEPYSRALNALEKVVDSTQAIKQIGKGMTFWVSGLYTQGQLASMFGNPAMKLKHYGIMAGTHYKDAATQQIFGVAVNVGFGNSISRGDRDLRTDNKAAQITLYYNKKFDASWKFSWHNTLMRSMDRHQRPFTDAAGNKQIALSNGVTYEFSSMMEVSYKHEFSKDNYIKPFTAISYTSNKEMAYQEKNVGVFNKAYDSAGMEQIGLQFGIKSSIGHQISDTKTF